MTKIIALTSENVKRLSVVHIEPTGAIVSISGKNGAGKCLPEGTMVSLWSGKRKCIEDIRENDLLVGLEPDRWEFIPEHPIAVATSGVQEVFEVKTRRGFNVQATANHRLLGANGWIEIKSLAVGDYLAVPMRLPTNRDADGLSPEEAMLLGLLLGDGCLTRGFSFACGDPSVKAEFYRCVQSLWPNAAIREYKQKDSIGCMYDVSKGCKKGRLTGPHLDWLQKLGLRGCNSYTKFIPEVVYGSGEESLRMFVAGLFSTDGWIREDGLAEYYSRSINLIGGARALLLRLGIATSMTTYMIAKNKTSPKAPMYKVTVVSGPGRDRFCETVIPKICRSKLAPAVPTYRVSACFGIPPEGIDALIRAGGQDVSAWVRGHHTMSRERFLRAVDEVAIDDVEVLRFASKDVGWDKIVSVTSVGRKQTFDLQMPNEAFIANDFIVHNSSVLDSIAMALGGKDAIPPMPVHVGKERAQIVVKLSNGLIVTRTFTAAGGTALKVTNAEGAAYSSPQKMLDDLTGAVAFDPLAFLRLEPKKQSETLRRLTGLDFAQQDAERARLYADRTAANKRLGEMRAAVAGLPEYKDAPTAEVSSQAILVQIEECQKQNAEKGRLDMAVTSAQTALTLANATAKRTADQIAALEKQLATLKAQLARENKSVDDLTAQLGTAQETAAAFQPVDTTSLKTQLAQCEETNRKVRANVARAKAITEGLAKKQESEVLTRKIEAIDAAKAQTLAEADMPVEGLAFTEDGVTFEGIPLVQCSSALQQRISVAIGAALNSKLKVMLIRDGSLLDPDSLEALRQTAEELGLQIWLEKVSDGPECSVIIENGEVKGAVESVPAEDRAPAKPSRKRAAKSAGSSAPADTPTETATAADRPF